MFSAYEKMRDVLPHGVKHEADDSNHPYYTAMDADKVAMDVVLCGIPLEKEMWVCTEKVHGCNFAVSVDLKTMLCTPARRSDFLRPDETFFPGWKGVYMACVESCTELAAKLKSEQDITQVIIYGELFGGGYPGYPAADMKPIQTDLLYRPNMDFFAYDIATVDSTGNKKYLEYTDAGLLFMAYGFRHWAKPLFIGSLEAAMGFPIETFKSTVAVEDNVVPIEGVVIKKIGDERAVIKLKAKRFTETLKGASKARKNYVTPARLVNVVSKIGPQLDETLVITELLNDIKLDDPAVDVNVLYTSALKLVRGNKQKWMAGSGDVVTATD